MADPTKLAVNPRHPRLPAKKLPDDLVLCHGAGPTPAIPRNIRYIRSPIPRLPNVKGAAGDVETMGPSNERKRNLHVEIAGHARQRPDALKLPTPRISTWRSRPVAYQYIFLEIRRSSSILPHVRRFLVEIEMMCAPRSPRGDRR